MLGPTPAIAETLEITDEALAHLEKALGGRPTLTPSSGRCAGPSCGAGAPSPPSTPSPADERRAHDQHPVHPSTPSTPSTSTTADDTVAQGPLAGVRVVELGQVIAGPYWPGAR